MTKKTLHYIYLILIVCLPGIQHIKAQEYSVTSAEKAYDQQEYQKAFEEYYAIYESDTSRIECLEKAGMCAFQLGDFPLAKSCFLVIEKADPDRVFTLTRLATIFELEENAPKAIEAAISKQAPIYHRLLASIYDQKNDMKNAIKHYKASYYYDPDPVLLFYLGRATDIYYKDKNVAIRYYSGYIKSSHDNEEYKQYSQQRRNSLREQIHFTNANN